ncbi:P2Y purinoceptor 2-like [Alligator sinensis]|uniref:P2Y purinoceptor 2-like n=1 Tax=Alligator sinensis TaxID=38654 RepID=A0A3Q0H197_ALLSI|nr:P2Y purinoceptor 2-like [Alligator sinensis]
MEETSLGCVCKQKICSLIDIFMKRDHMRDLRRYLVLKYIQYLVLPSSNTLLTLLGLLGSLYTTLILKSPNISYKCTVVFISHLAKADSLVFVSMVSKRIVQTFDAQILPATFTTTLLQNFLTANTHISYMLLSCVACEALLITLFPAESRHIRTVKHARQTSNIIWSLVIAECIIFQMAGFQEADIASFGINSRYIWLFHFSYMAASLLRSLTSFIGLSLRIINVYIYYKIFFNASNTGDSKT